MAEVDLRIQFNKRSLGVLDKLCCSAVFQEDLTVTIVNVNPLLFLFCF